ncbi:hypothetical protein [Pseudovibrio brasiliensis]|uniref:Uncharacterized protein n=1 Tax=Pseudovibrio brasiliensis TaxID=1898042 RepID=A0ABX8AJV2_9HYPH|nr:hypothetical protein [Pseudovibrio brasiliensis]QUS54527.1 hypothetical protein KGB56_14115 [Pseudovibrio brasiliensis]
MDALKPKGRYAIAGAIGDPQVELNIRTLYLTDLRFIAAQCWSRKCSSISSAISRRVAS